MCIVVELVVDIGLKVVFVWRYVYFFISCKEGVGSFLLLSWCSVWCVWESCDIIVLIGILSRFVVF